MPWVTLDSGIASKVQPVAAETIKDEHKVETYETVKCKHLKLEDQVSVVEEVKHEEKLDLKAPLVKEDISVKEVPQVEDKKIVEYSKSSSDQSDFESQEVEIAKDPLEDEYLFPNRDSARHFFRDLKSDVLKEAIKPLVDALESMTDVLTKDQFNLAKKRDLKLQIKQLKTENLNLKAKLREEEEQRKADEAFILNARAMRAIVNTMDLDLE